MRVTVMFESRDLSMQSYNILIGYMSFIRFHSTSILQSLGSEVDGIIRHVVYYSKGFSRLKIQNSVE